MKKSRFYLIDLSRKKYVILKIFGPKVCNFLTGHYWEILRLRKFYGDGRWRKRKGHALVRLSDGTIVKAEIHWYEATGIGKREFKIKRYLEEEHG